MAAEQVNRTDTGSNDTRPNVRIIGADATAPTQESESGTPTPYRAAMERENIEQAVKLEDMGVGPEPPPQGVFFLITGGSFSLTGGQEFLNQIKVRLVKEVEDKRFHALAIDWSEKDQAKVKHAGYEFFPLNLESPATTANMKDCLKKHDLADDIKQDILKSIEGDVAGTPRMMRLLLEANEPQLKKYFEDIISRHVTQYANRFYFYMVFSPCCPTGSTTALFLAQK